MKKIILTILPAVVILIAVGIFLFATRTKKYTVSIENWNDKTDKFELCTIEMGEKYKGGSGFRPRYKEEFIDEITAKEEYVGRHIWIHEAAVWGEGYLFMHNDGMFVLYETADGYYMLKRAVCIYSPEEWGRCVYPAPIDWEPDNVSGVLNYDESKFDEGFGTYDEAVRTFYGFFSDDTVVLDDENQTITVKVQDFYYRKSYDDRKIVIDFVNKNVTEVRV